MDRYELARQIEHLAGHANGPVKDTLRHALEQLLKSGAVALTARDLKGLAPGSKIQDPTLPGLTAFHSKRHGISWHLRLRKPQDKLVQLGLWPEVSCEAARIAARDVKAGRLSIGMAEKKTAQIVSRRLLGPTRLNHVVTFYLEQYAEKYSSASTTRHARANLDRFVKMMGDPPIEQITPEQVRDTLVDINRKYGPQAAAKTRSSLSKAWQVCQGLSKELQTKSSEQLIKASQMNPTLGIKFASSAEQWPLSPSEIDHYWINLPHVQGIPETVQDLLALQAVTVSRIGEITGIKNEWVSLADGWVDLPVTKNKGNHRLMLTREGRVIVGKHYSSEREYLFQGPRLGKPYHPNSVNTLVRDNLKQLGIFRSGEALALKGQPNTHAVRRFGVTYLTEQGVDPRVVDRAINHRPRGVTSKYNWSAHLWPQVYEALQLVEDRLMAAILER